MPTVLQAQLNDANTSLIHFHGTVIVGLFVNRHEPYIMVIGKACAHQNHRNTMPT
jgi:hypothetical protein